MAHYTSKYKSLGFYVDDAHYHFSNGEFNTEDKSVIAVLDKVSDAIKTEEAAPKPKPATTKKPTTKAKED